MNENEQEWYDTAVAKAKMAKEEGISVLLVRHGESHIVVTNCDESDMVARLAPVVTTGGKP